MSLPINLSFLSSSCGQIVKNLVSSWLTEETLAEGSDFFITYLIL